mmetsp:Transcript_34328/g.77576  ORF Transcript_34328/g.77576 Transcript_34328/m.77576 type:complete len:201 (+) Transcript_34328:144-746(+)
MCLLILEPSAHVIWSSMSLVTWSAGLVTMSGPMRMCPSLRNLWAIVWSCPNLLETRIVLIRRRQKRLAVSLSTSSRLCVFLMSPMLYSFSRRISVILIRSASLDGIFLSFVMRDLMWSTSLRYLWNSSRSLMLNLWITLSSLGTSSCHLKKLTFLRSLCSWYLSSLIAEALQGLSGQVPKEPAPRQPRPPLPPETGDASA